SRPATGWRNTFIAWIFLTLAGAASAWRADPPAQPEAHLSRVVGTSIELIAEDGAVRAGAALVGAELTLGTGPTAPRIRILSVVEDGGHGVLLHEIEAMGADGAWANICEPDRENRRLALFIEGHDLPDGRQVQVAGRLSITCTGGVQAKCLRAGYTPWVDPRLAGSGPEMFQTCTRMFRADYCGDGLGWTRNGMRIDIADVRGMVQPEQPATLPFEAAWGPDGAVCVHHVRVAERGSLADVLAHCPRLNRVPAGASCTEAAARAMPGVLMFNRSLQPADGPTMR
ncbi:MAG: ADYC domain-containing protein, partial [Burkholderiaceae bacterium]